jgi:23S rRNA G2445 N2-methylase RlmL
MHARVHVRVYIYVHKYIMQIQTHTLAHTQTHTHNTHMPHRTHVRSTREHISILFPIHFTRTHQAVRNAIMDKVRELGRPRPPPPVGEADLPLYCTFYRDYATVYRDMSGDSLHRRGYRSAKLHPANLSETAAAGILILTGWRSDCVHTLVDPMCGSGTFILEAAMMALNIAPGLERARDRAFLRWNDLNNQHMGMWDACVQDAKTAARRWDGKPLILGNDIEP